MKHSLIAISLAALLAASAAGCAGMPEDIMNEEEGTTEAPASGGASAAEPVEGCTSIAGSNLGSGEACDDDSDCASGNCYTFEDVCECIGDEPGE